jgi:hypothetical protein
LNVVWFWNLGAGATTLIEKLSSGLVAIGCMRKCIKLICGERVVSTIQVESPVCFIMDLPALGQFLATGYKGQIWIFDYSGKCVDCLASDSRENNPIWIVQQLSPEVVTPAWANGIIRHLQL